METGKHIDKFSSPEFIQYARKYTDSLYTNLQTNNSAETIITDIQQQAYHEIQAVLDKKQFVRAANTFNDFLSLPQETKNQFAAKVNAKKWFDAWYINKSREKWDTDNKQYFHYNLYTEQILADQIQKFPQAQEFIYAARQIYITSVTQIANILKTRENKYPGIYKLFIQEGEDPHFFIRFLSYEVNIDQDNDKKFSAKWHYDRGSMTIAHAESHPWLRIWADKENLQDVIHKDGKAKYFLSWYFPKLIIKHYPETLTQEQQNMLQNNQEEELIQSINEQLPLWFHDVIQQQTGQKRRAIVAFFDAIHEDELSYEATHTPIDAKK